MAIPEAQLETWSNQGATTTSTDAYGRIRRALEKEGSPIAGRGKEIYLQGSYINATNIYGDSDIDVVVQLNDTFQRDISRLPPDQVEIYNRNHHTATYRWEHFRADVIKTLEDTFGTPAVKPSAKSIKVNLGTGRPADVIPALHYRVYEFHRGIGRPHNESYVDGIHFKDPANVAIVNYPKLHIDNGRAKNATGRTNGLFKPGVRMFKNARNKMVEDGLIEEGSVPSYFLECLLYNTPDNLWVADKQETYANVVNHLYGLDLTPLRSQNGRLSLFGPSSTQWETAAATAFIAGLVTLWTDW